VNWIRLAEIMVHWRGGGGSYERGNEYSFSIKIGQYVYQLGDYGLINMQGRPTSITA